MSAIFTRFSTARMTCWLASFRTRGVTLDRGEAGKRDLAGGSLATLILGACVENRYWLAAGRGRRQGTVSELSEDRMELCKFGDDWALLPVLDQIRVSSEILVWYETRIVQSNWFLVE